MPFDSDFPFAFRFDETSQRDCKDLRNDMLAWSTVMSTLFGLILRASSGVFFWVRCVHSRLLSNTNDIAEADLDMWFPQSASASDTGTSRSRAIRATSLVSGAGRASLTRPAAPLADTKCPCSSIPPSADLAGAFETFLPCLFICHVFYRFAFRWVLPAFNGRIFERTVWFYGAFWVFLLSNVRVPSSAVTSAGVSRTD